MRGYQKRVFYLKNTGSSIFEEAFFLVRGEEESRPLSESDMIVEANRIIEESLDAEECGFKRERGRIFLKFLTPFFLGALTTAAIVAILALIF